MTEQTQDALRQIESLIRARRYRSFTLRVQLLKPNRFVTACMEFSQDPASEGNEPEILDYPPAILASFSNDVETWHDFATRLMSGNLIFGSSASPANLSYESSQEELYLGNGSNRPRTIFLFSQNTHEQLWTNSPFVGIGLPPFTNSADAAARYVHKIPVALNQTLHENKLAISLPGQPKIRLVEWLPGELRVQLVEREISGHQLHIFYWQQNRVADTQSLKQLAASHDLQVPARITTIAGHLLASDGSIAQSFVLNSPYSFLGDAESALSFEHQIRADILAGENESREMKAFFNPDDNKEMRDRVLASCIAFANTGGGRVYIGVEDDGALSGNAKLMRTQKKSKSPEDAAGRLSAHLRKVILENTRPVIEVEAAPFRIASEWVVRLQVQQSLQMVTTHSHDVFIRAGASNYKPSAEWLESRNSRQRFQVPGIEPWRY